MGVPLQLILGILLVVATCNFAEPHKLRQVRAAPSTLPTPTQNVTEINNRDLNQIVKNNPKTETLDSKAKTVNNVNSYEEFPVKLGKSDEDNGDTAQKNHTKEEKPPKEVEVKDAALPKPNKEKLREDNSRAIDIDASKFWSSDFHNKNNVFTLSPQVAPVHPPENSFGGTRHPSFESNTELTTPKTKLFDKKFKETVESVEQTLDDVNLDNEEHNTREVEDDNEDLAVDDPLNRHRENSTVEFENSKTVVNNETVEKNSIHKDLDFEQIKKTKLETTFNDTKVYDGEANKGEVSTTEKTNSTSTIISTTAAPVDTTRKNSLRKDLVGKKTTTHLISNNIETEFVNPTKGISTTTESSTTLKLKGDPDDVKLTPSLTSTTESSLIKTTTIIAINISDQENVIPLQQGTESSLKKKYTELATENPKNRNAIQKQVIINQRVAAADTTTTTTETIPSTTEIFEATTTDVTTINNILSDATTAALPEEGTTTFVVELATEISDATTESSEIPTTLGNQEAFTNDHGIRTSKSLDASLITEQITKTSERIVESSTRAIEASTETTIKNELDSTTLNNGKLEEDKDNSIQKTRDIEATTTEAVTSTTMAVNEETTTFVPLPEIVAIVTTTTQKALETTGALTRANAPTTTEEPVKINMSTESSTTTEEDTPVPTTTEFSFIHIENTARNHTTFLPEILSPNLNYSTSAVPDRGDQSFRKIVLNDSATEESSSSSSSTTTVSSTSEEPLTVTVATEVGTEVSPTENSSFSNEGEGDGGNRGKIAAIAISSVGAVCLVLLAGLLYVMKKRQKRLNYGPRCRPVSLDDYSIDNLSVYNSVRRKGGPRMSKRSFGNPAFEDPVAPTHPLNFPALAKFSTNFEDIKAEFEEVPQITARTSELPEGCDTKNRYANVIPLPETRVFLNPIDGYPNSDYINANYVTGPKNIKEYYIATQGPMQNTVDDFWRMVWEQQTKVILMLTHLVENGLEKCVDYLPESEVLECSRLFGDFQITLKKREVKEKYIISSLQLKNMVSNSWREVTHFWYLGWPEKGVPSEANSLIAFLIEARSYMKAVTMDKKDAVNGIQNGGTHCEHNPVVIHCSPGTGRTGVAIACDIAIREFETTRLVDIPKIVYRIRRDRANAIQTKEQYIFIYKVVSLYATKLTGGALDNL